MPTVIKRPLLNRLSFWYLILQVCIHVVAILSDVSWPHEFYKLTGKATWRGTS